MNKTEVRNLINILTKATQLKEIHRTGWVLKGVQEAESVADHSWGVLFLVLLLKPKNLDLTKLLKMAAVHDLGEIQPGDVRWEAGKNKIGSQSKKRLKEINTVKKLFQTFPLGKEYVQLLKEFNDQHTPEAKYLKQVEKLEMLSQAYVYEKNKRAESSLDEFWENVEMYLEGKELEPLFRELEQMRKSD